MRLDRVVRAAPDVLDRSRDRLDEIFLGGGLKGQREELGVE